MKKIIGICRKYADGWIFFAASVFLLLFAVIELQTHLRLTAAPPILLRLLLLLTVCALFFLGAHLHAGRTQSNRIFRHLTLLFFALYLYLLLNVTLLEKGFGRDTLIGTDSDARAYYLQYFVNLRPFQSIWEVYVLGFLKGYVAPYYVLLNLLGNVCAMMPLSYLLPRLFPKQRRWYVFLPTVLLAVITVELLQFIFMVGSCDVDDLILNAGGAILLYFLLRIPRLSRWIDRLFPQV
ncbi:MAG: VanZ family protein [Clostridia bacterium]|nr:VanZ family protein [Clostridia bacterium]